MKDFWEQVNRYKQLGIDPLKWVAGCAVKVDLTTVVYPALKKIRPRLREYGITVNPREDADIFPCFADGIKLERRIYDLNEPKVDAEDLRGLDPVRAISLVQVHQRRADTPENFADILLKLYSQIGRARVNFTVGKGHSIITAYPEAQFALFDFVKRGERMEGGWTLANNDTIQVIDPTDDPGSEAQAYVAVSNSLNDLIALGCYEHLAVYPVIDAPTEELHEKIFHHMKSFGSKFGVEVHDCPPINFKKLLIGATVVGDVFKELPTRADRLAEGMKILLSRPIGDLAPINVYLSCLADEEYLKTLEEHGFSLSEVEKAKNEVIETMKKPNLKIGKVINQYCPEIGQPFNESLHVADTGDVSGPGIYIFKEMAEIAGIDIRLDQIPLAYPDYVKFASQNYLMDNGTAGTNGAVAIVASEAVVEQVAADLSRAGYEPVIIGRILGNGEGKVYVNEGVKEVIASKSLLDEFQLVKGEGGT